MFNEKAADGETFVYIYGCICFMTVSNYEVFEEIHELDSGIVIIINHAVWFVYGQVAYVEALSERPLPKVELQTLTCL